MPRKIFLSLLGVVCLSFIAGIIAPPGVSSATDKQPDTVLLTIFLKHDQSKTLAEIDRHLEKTGFWKKFPPEGTEVVSWYVMMGIGQVVTLRLPPEKLRAVNLAIEQNAWGAFKTDFFPTYDFRPVWESTYRKLIFTHRLSVYGTLISLSGETLPHHNLFDRDPDETLAFKPPHF